MCFLIYLSSKWKFLQFSVTYFKYISDQELKNFHFEDKLLKKLQQYSSQDYKEWFLVSTKGQERSMEKNKKFESLS